ncbi:NADPH--cytochrome P450 reductase [Gryllus bimaculatus]|nr:NADPH--cytochrome P450 reductase [Gryllus bimaculatus]
MYSVFGIPLVGTLFVPILIGALTFVIWCACARKEHVPLIETIPYKENDSKIVNVSEINSSTFLEKDSKKKKKKCKKDGGCCSKTDKTSESHQESVEIIKIFYATLTGKAEEFSISLSKKLSEIGFRAEIKSGRSVCVFILPTYTDGTPPPDGEWFYKWLEEASTDFRMGKCLLEGLKYAVFGLGNSQYSEHFNVVGKRVDHWLHKLQAIRVTRLGLGNEDTANSRNWSIEEDFNAWSNVLLSRLKKWQLLNEEKESKCCCKGSGNNTEDNTCSESDSTSNDGSDSEGGVVDVEELGRFSGPLKEAKIQDEVLDVGKEMITPALRASLTKQGYRLIGSHSGVKLCRWTKSMLRGRGGCYKHSFYGIQSHQCMETTPSLACANKCVFCWRHHSNPVGTEWKWKMDQPEEILNEALNQHYKMIYQFKGVPGVLPERLEEGLHAKHCALSLVGEPIMYPEINKFVNLLHKKGISSFLVTNAQFPDAMREMSPVTQLYVSVDASTKESLKKIDRPLFKDFWERFVDSLIALSEKGQRTVYRLTLVKAWNVDEIENYAKLVGFGKPDFIEVKGVTYCGTSKASNLSMENVPWHEEVVSFVEKLANLLDDYEIASEHEHSNCVLIAHKKFKVNGDWWTWIDYDKFHELIQEFYSSNGEKKFTALDYMAKTPSWATYGASEKGFNPNETRWYRKNPARKDVSGC